MSVQNTQTKINPRARYSLQSLSQPQEEIYVWKPTYISQFNLPAREIESISQNFKQLTPYRLNLEPLRLNGRVKQLILSFRNENYILDSSGSVHIVYREIDEQNKKEVLRYKYKNIVPFLNVVQIQVTHEWIYLLNDEGDVYILNSYWYKIKMDAQEKTEGWISEHSEQSERSEG